MLRDLLFALRRLRWNQMIYFRHAHSPFSPWRRQIASVVEQAGRLASEYGIKSPVDRRRAYQIARMVVSNRLGDHLCDLVADAYLAYSPPSAATFHSGRRKYDSPSERRAAFLRHPQTLAYVLTPPKLARLGLGVSSHGGIVVISAGEDGVSQEVVMQRLSQLVGARASDADLRAYAEILLRLNAGIPAAEPAAQDEAA